MYEMIYTSFFSFFCFWGWGDLSVSQLSELFKRNWRIYNILGGSTLINNFCHHEMHGRERKVRLYMYYLCHEEFLICLMPF